MAAAILKAYEEAVPAWISGYVSSAADDVEISFSDGTWPSSHLELESQ